MIRFTTLCGSRRVVGIIVSYTRTTDGIQWLFKIGENVIFSFHPGVQTHKQPSKTVSNLHESHSGHQDEQRDPLVDAQPAAQHGHGEQRCGQDLQLVRHLMDTKWGNSK